MLRRFFKEEGVSPMKLLTDLKKHSVYQYSFGFAVIDNTC